MAIAWVRPTMDVSLVKTLAPITLAVLGVLAAAMSAATQASRAAAERRSEERRSGPSALRGSWIWAGVEDSGHRVLDVVESDLVRRDGPTGWPGCARGVVCTRHGIRVLVIAGDGSARWITNVKTSSDFESVGRIQWTAPGVARFDVAHRFSCAHPRLHERDRESRVVRFHRDGELLRVAVENGTAVLPLPLAVSPDVPTRWMVFRRVSDATLRDRYLLRLCQPEPDSPCDARCFDAMPSTEPTSS